MKFKYKRVLLKLSGEAFGGQSGINFQKVDEIAELLKQINQDTQVAVVNGAGNLFRGANQGKEIDREEADYIGMVATIMNSLALQALLREKNVPVSIYSAWEIKSVAPLFQKERAIADLDENRVVIATAGTGEPFFTTDTAGVQRAVELECDLMIKASTIDGVYSNDPKVDSSAEKFEHITYDQILQEDLKVLDRSAVEIAKKHDLKIIVCECSSDNILSALRDEENGTLISS